MNDRQFSLIHGLSGTALALVTVLLCICNLAEVSLPRWAVVLAIIVVAVAGPLTLWGAVKLITKEHRPQ